MYICAESKYLFLTTYQAAPMNLPCIRLSSTPYEVMIAARPKAKQQQRQVRIDQRKYERTCAEDWGCSCITTVC